MHVGRASISPVSCEPEGTRRERGSHGVANGNGSNDVENSRRDEHQVGG